MRILDQIESSMTETKLCVRNLVITSSKNSIKSQQSLPTQKQ